MTTSQETQKWVYHYQQKFNLQEWKINISYISENDISPAFMSFKPAYREAFLEINTPSLRRCLRDKSDSIQAIVKHELLHLFHSDHTHLIRTLFNLFVKEEEQEGFRSHMLDLDERLVTKLERIIK